MAKYLIHAVPKRMKYVEEYLIPSMTEQGIALSDISVYNDYKGEGNLKSCMTSFSQMSDDAAGTWHLQDDIIVCRDFKERTEQYDDGVVCGFSSGMYDGEGNVGDVSIWRMWFSFPCIRIPNQYARECAEWVNRYVIGNPVYKAYWQKGVNDDWMFRMYTRNFHMKERALNLAPNLVDHIDYLLGGGTNRDKQREKPCRSQYWEDNDLVEELERKLKNDSLYGVG